MEILKKKRPEADGAENAGREKKRREAPFYLTVRDSMPFWETAGIRALSILAALIVCGIVTVLLTKDNPLAVYVTMFDGAFGNSNRVWMTFQNLAILLCISLALTPAFKMRFWNIGAEGQVLIGGLATAVCMFFIGDSVPEWLLILIMIFASIFAGVLWGVIPAFFKAQWNTNETLFTLMMNYVSIQLIEYFLKVADKSGSNTVGPNILKYGWLPEIGGQKFLLNIIVVAALTVVMYVYMNLSKQGYEIAVVGESENTARYIGINVKKVIIRTMAISGAICGLTGLLLVGGTSHAISSTTADGRGFTAIMVTWLGKFNPLYMILTSFLIVFLERGADEVSTKFELNNSFSDIITGIIIFFIIGCEFLIRYKINRNQNFAPRWKKRLAEEATDK